MRASVRCAFAHLLLDVTLALRGLMIQQPMYTQRGRVGEVLLTAVDAAAEGIRLRVQLEMVLEVLLHFELFVAAGVLAHKGTVLRVCALVAGQQRAVDKALAAALNLADPRLLARVDPIMPVQTPP